MKVLNLYAGIGGNRKLWGGVEVTAVELNPDIAAIYKANGKLKEVAELKKELQESSYELGPLTTKVVNQL